MQPKEETMSREQGKREVVMLLEDPVNFSATDTSELIAGTAYL